MSTAPTSGQQSMTRGYSMTSTWKYIDSKYDADIRQKIIDQLSPEVRNALGTYKEIDFYPVMHFSEVLRGIATIVGKDTANARTELRGCGNFIARQATNTFLRLLMKVLTPTLFAKKIPDLWSRDNNNGRFEVDLAKVGDGRIVFRMLDVGDYKYSGPCAMGWITFAMEQMGKEIESMTLLGWSLDEPDPNEVTIELQLGK